MAGMISGLMPSRRCTATALLISGCRAPCRQKRKIDSGGRGEARADRIARTRPSRRSMRGTNKPTSIMIRSRAPEQDQCRTGGPSQAFVQFCQLVPKPPARAATSGVSTMGRRRRPRQSDQREKGPMARSQARLSCSWWTVLTYYRRPPVHS